jgi:hypothetical protein
VRARLRTCRTSPSVPRNRIPGAAEGDDFSDLCRDPACPCCVLWPAPGESDAAWKTRIRRLYRAAPALMLEHRKDRSA